MGLLALFQRTRATKPPTAAPPSFAAAPRDYHELDDLIHRCVDAVPEQESRVAARYARDLLRSIFADHPTAVREALAKGAGR